MQSIICQSERGSVAHSPQRRERGQEWRAGASRVAVLAGVGTDSDGSRAARARHTAVHCEGTFVGKCVVVIRRGRRQPVSGHRRRAGAARGRAGARASEAPGGTRERPATSERCSPSIKRSRPFIKTRLLRLRHGETVTAESARGGVRPSGTVRGCGNSLRLRSRTRRHVCRAFLH